MGIWHKLSIKQKFLTVFIIQNISLLLALIFLGANFGLIIFMGLLVLFFFYNYNNSTKKYFLIFSIVMMCHWLLDNSMSLRSDINVNYNQLKSYTGNTAPINSNPGGGGSHHHYMKLEKNKNGNYRDGSHRDFICGIKSFSSCTNEAVNYFGKGNTYDKNLSVKYDEFSDIHMIFIIPFFIDENIIYEIKYNDKVIYNYDYFINKYTQQQKNAKIYSIYLILNTLLFCVFYHWIQKSVNQNLSDILNNE